MPSLTSNEVFKYRPTTVLNFIREHLDIPDHDIGTRVKQDFISGNKESKKYIYIINQSLDKCYYITYESYFGESIILYFNGIQSEISTSYKFALNNLTLPTLTEKDKEELLEIVLKIKIEIENNNLK